MKFTFNFVSIINFKSNVLQFNSYVYEEILDLIISQSLEHYDNQNYIRGFWYRMNTQMSNIF